MDPEKHYLEHGMKEKRVPNLAFSSAYVSRQLNQFAMIKKTVFEHYQDSDLPKRIRIVFVSHDATRTGAPAIILRLISMFSNLQGVECISILDDGGDRLDEFKYVSHVYTMQRHRYDLKATTEGSFNELNRLFGPDGAFSDNLPVVALINSAESLRIAKLIHQFGIPIVSLLHEFATYYQPEHFREFTSISEQVILPSNFIMKLSSDYADLDNTKLVVRGQGLLDDNFGSLNRDVCRDQLLRDLKLPEDSFIVLNAGTMDQRKGIDHFVYAASLFVDRYPEIKNVYFVWYGAGDKSSGSAYSFAKKEIERYELGERVLFMPSTANIEPVFMGSDVFFLSARADPFPCVIHEALACSLPVIAFRNGGGAPELIGNDCGTIVELGDISAVVDTIYNYMTDDIYYKNHSDNARKKIMNDWQYIDYFNFVHKTLNRFSKRKLPLKISHLSNPIEHLIILEGNWETWNSLFLMRSQHPLNNVVFNFINGKNSKDISELVEHAKKTKHRYFVSQPREKNLRAVREIIKHEILNIEPKELTFVDFTDCIDVELLSVRSFRKRLMLTDQVVDSEVLYAVGLYFDEIWTFDETIAAKIALMNPLISEKIKVFQSPQR